MAISKKSLNDKLRARYMDAVASVLASMDEEVLVTGSNEFAVPCVDEAGNDEFVVITFKIPSGSRDGDVYDGYSMAEQYAMKCAEKETKAKENAKKKAEKIAKDKAMREEKARLKAEALANKA